MSLVAVEVVSGSVFGEIKVDAVSNKSLRNFYEDTVLPLNKLAFTSKHGDKIELKCHDIFVDKEKDTELNNRASVTFIVSMDVDESNKETAFMAANYKFNEEVIDFFTFDLEDYDKDKYSFNVIDFEIEFNEFVYKL